MATITGAWSSPMLPTLALTFDQDTTNNTYLTAYPMMNPNPQFAGGPLVGTVYIKPSLVGTAGYFNLPQLVILKMIGWEIGVYLPGDNVALCTADRDAAFAAIKTSADALQALGFAPATIAPGGRLWNKYLGNMARGRFKGVRIPQGYVWPQPYPIADPVLGVSGGGAASWGIDQAAIGFSDTAASILARVDALIASGPGNMATEVIHNIGPVADAKTILTSEAQAAFVGIAQRRDAGLLRVATFEQALTPG